jgi:hypothetical protein
MKRPCILLTLIAVSFCCGLSPSAQQSPITEMKIKSTWVGLGSPSKTEFLITFKEGRYTIGTKKIDSHLIDALAAAVNEPTIPEPTLQNLGLTSEWLGANAEPAADKYASSYTHAAASNQRELYRSSFTNQGIILEIVRPLYMRGFHTDDYPEVEVTITERSGRKIIISSEGQQPYMLPWTVDEGGRKTKTFNTHISGAIRALMPLKSTNRERLTDSGLDSALAEGVMNHILTNWNLLDVENRARSSLMRIRSAYQIRSAEINGYHGVAYGKEWKNGNPQETNFHAEVTKKEFPPNFFEDLIFLFKDDNVEGIESFLESGEAYEDLLLSVEWLKVYRDEKPDVVTRLFYVHDRSFSDKAMQLFAADMAILGKDALAREIAGLQDRIALAQIGTNNFSEGFWLILPDRRVILWRYSGNSGLLKWNVNNFQTHRCADYNTPYGGCVGAIISPDGTLIP